MMREGARRRRDGRRRGVALREASAVPYASPVVGKGAPFTGQIPGCFLRLFLYKTHDAARHLQGICGIVGDAEGDEHVGETHDAEPDLPVGLGDVFDHRHGILARVYNVIEEPHCEVYEACQSFPVHIPVFHELHEIDGTEAAGFVGQEGLLGRVFVAPRSQRAAWGLPC